MDLYFPNLGVALVVRRKRPPNGQFVTDCGADSVYLVPAKRRPPNAKVAEKLLGGWNYDNGVAVHLVRGKTLSNMFRFRLAENGEWIVFPRRHADEFVGLIKTQTGVPVSIGVTPVLLK